MRVDGVFRTWAALVVECRCGFHVLMRTAHVKCPRCESAIMLARQGRGWRIAVRQP